MSCFDYPLDPGYLIRKKKFLRESLLENQSNYIEKNVAVLGGSTTRELVDQLELFLLYHGIKPSFYESDYNRFYEDAVFGNSTLDSFKPDLIIIYTSSVNLIHSPSVDNSSEDIESFISDEISRFYEIWAKLKEKFNCPIIQNNFEKPDVRLLGNRDIWDCRGLCNYIFRLNDKLYRYAQDNENFFINDIDYIAGDLGYSFWHDPKSYALYKYICSLKSIPYVAHNLARIIKSLYGKNKKVLALDLDNTIWGGVVGDDGADNLEIGKESAVGQIFYDFQSYCKNLKKQGVLLAVDSKNDMVNAQAGLAHKDNVIRESDFVAIEANWDPKDKNLETISHDLNLGLDSFVFVDDNPAEREIVKSQLPLVSVVDSGEPETYRRIIDRNGFFEVTSISGEDLNRSDKYQARKAAINEMRQFGNYEEYLDNLHMVASIMQFEPQYIQRIAQLTNKTNQFNLTTKRFTEAQIQQIKESSERISICGKLKDKFTEHGLVSVVSGQIIESCLYIDLWLMSCRVLKRNLETVMLNHLIELCVQRKISRVIGIYIPTEKNTIVENMYEGFGFKQVKRIDEDLLKKLPIEEEKKTRCNLWELYADSYVAKNSHMDVEILS